MVNLGGISKVLRAGLFAGASVCAVSTLSIATVTVDEDMQSYSGQPASNDSGYAPTVGQVKDRIESIDIARELTITKGVADAYYKLPRLEQYTPKPLMDEAKGVAVVNGIPLNCKLLGESEGIDSSDGRTAPSFETIREGALNDLRNATMDLVDSSREQVVITPVKEAMTCELALDGNQFEEKDCTTWTQIPSNGKILFYRIHANVYSCGVR